MSDDLDALVQAAVARMKVDLADGYRLAAKVALAALEPSDGAVYTADFKAQMAALQTYERVKQKLEEAATAWNIDMEEKS